MQKIKFELDNPKLRIVLWILFWLAILRQLSSLKSILDKMSTADQNFPLQNFLGLFESIWDVVNVFWSTIFGTWLSYQVFENYAWGGFTMATLIWSVIKFSQRPEELILNHSNLIKKNQILLLIYALFFMLTIVYGLNRDQLIPYIQEPSWEINIVHKQQVSAGTFFIIYYVILLLSFFPHVRGHAGSLNFVGNRKIMTYTFFIMTFEIFASFSWFPGPIDPNNRWIDGYEEIFQEEQNWTSSDKIFHFSMSSVAIILILMFIKNIRKGILYAISIVIFWELFEISLNPLEASDSLLDMVINSSAILLTAWLYNRWNINVTTNNQSFDSDNVPRN
ncbi:MAG: hypothetical protein HeimC2_24470 [Candidatus Heimdallarchaeota archaeon LC_2]|nr:MAG: hypothetical protein HeimC2_24470 [Candidatus Heimdallarchaeota archaeon LC_2]